MLEILNEMFKGSLEKPSPYSNFTSIIQSSGTGKSRTVREMGKLVLSVPIVLREEEETGVFQFEFALGLPYVKFQVIQMAINLLLTSSRASLPMKRIVASGTFSAIFSTQFEKSYQNCPSVNLLQNNGRCILSRKRIRFSSG
jgi:hypothetical protein